MGLFGSIKKEVCINALAQHFKIMYRCGDYAAIECLRKNYTLQELQGILDLIETAIKIGEPELIDSSPFKEDQGTVSLIDARYRGK